ncbi:Hypothetical predicted protein [Lecanosticta acicola]|uniref:Uncharacterized protein n=1 Tax=Lecanosticta acicola TaxID=111012 RepID=A0AAI9EES3_9PEZI|nr:Hypothetical predicted protein [Lecanosticta acicola]
MRVQTSLALRAELQRFISKSAHFSDTTTSATIVDIYNNMAPTKLQAARKELKLRELELRVLKRQTSARTSTRSAPSIGNHVLLLFVGAARELITLHTNLLPEITQAYLQARAIAAPFHQLPDESPGTVRIYRDYLYTGKIHSVAENDDTDELGGGITSQGEWSCLAQLYLLGIEVRDERFANQVIDSIIDKVEEDADEQHYPTGLANEVWTGTKTGDKLRKLIVDLHIWVGKGHGIDEQGQHDDRNGPMDFKHKVAMGVLKNRQAIYDSEIKAPWEVNACQYHAHLSTQPCGMKDVEIVDLTEE